MITVSVIMGIYNCAATLPEAIDSILKQTVSDWELIMCDDGSTDDTYSVALTYVQKYPNKIVLLKNEKTWGNMTMCLIVKYDLFICGQLSLFTGFPQFKKNNLPAMEET